jgi:hypothetical protein
MNLPHRAGAGQLFVGQRRRGHGIPIFLAYVFKAVSSQWFLSLLLAFYWLHNKLFFISHLAPVCNQPVICYLFV